MRKVYQEQTGRSENDSYETIRGTRIKSREGDLKMMMMNDALQHEPVAAVHCSFYCRRQRGVRQKRRQTEEREKITLQNCNKLSFTSSI